MRIGDQVVLIQPVVVNLLTSANQISDTGVVRVLHIRCLRFERQCQLIEGCNHIVTQDCLFHGLGRVNWWNDWRIAHQLRPVYVAWVFNIRVNQPLTDFGSGDAILTPDWDDFVLNLGMIEQNDAAVDSIFQCLSGFIVVVTEVVIQTLDEGDGLPRSCNFDACSKERGLGWDDNVEAVRVRCYIQNARYRF